MRPDLTIAIAGDWAPIRALEPVVRGTPEAAYGDTLPGLRAADLRVVNCECALTEVDEPVWKSGAVFKGRPGHVAGLAAVPFDVACLANNHVFDYGLRGFRETLDVLRRNGLRTVGAGLTRDEALAPLSVAAGKTRITILNFGEGEDLTASRGGPGVCGWEIPEIAARVRRAKARGDFVVVVAHAGLEYIPFPPPYVVGAFRALSDAGADCVVGHHPHVPQGLEVRRGNLIAYSLGNFVFWQPGDLYYRRTGFVLHLRVRRGRLAGYELMPYRITDRGLRRLRGREAAEFRRSLERVSKPLASAKGVSDAWRAYLSYYGPAGFKKEVLSILEKMETEPRKGAAMFRNRVTTLQHVELWRDALTQFMAGTPEPVPARLARTIADWFTRPVAE